MAKLPAAHSQSFSIRKTRILTASAKIKEINAANCLGEMFFLENMLQVKHPSRADYCVLMNFTMALLPSVLDR